MAGGSRGAAPTREGTHPDGRRARTPAPRAALGPAREGVPLRDRRGHADAGAAVRRPHSAARLPLHVRPQLRGRLPDVLVDGRHRRRRPPAPARARRDDDVRLAGAAGEAAGVQAADGLEHALVSSAGSDFNFDLGYSRTEEQTRQAIVPMLEAGAPPIAEQPYQNANSSGTDITGYLTEGQGFSAFVLDEGTVYQIYSTGARRVEFLMGYYGILDRAPKGRDEGDASQLWIRRHDEYDQNR